MFTFYIDEVTSMSDVSYSVSPHFQQSELWAQFKSLHGWKKKFFSITAKNEEGFSHSFYTSVLIRSIKNVFSIAYIPMAPVYEKSLSPKKFMSFCSQYAIALKKYLPKNTICLRIDPPIDFDNPDDRALFISSQPFGLLKKSSVDIQPADTAVLDIRKSQEELLKNMKSKWRYNIRLSARKGVTVCCTGSKDSDIFYDLFRETAQRDGIATHKKEYYKSLLSLSESMDENETVKVSLYIAYAPTAKDDSKPQAIAAIITLFVKGGEAVYLYGASSNQKRNLMPAYLLQWNAIKDAQSFGCVSYDFYGMPPTDDENHPMHGLWRFKTGFGGKNIHRPGSFDISLSPFYSLYTCAEKLRSWYHKSLKKKLKGR